MCANKTPSVPLVLTLAQGDTPIKVELSLTPSDEVQALRAQIASLEKDLQRLKDVCRQAEELYGFETMLNLELIDYCRDHQFKLPSRLLRRVRT